MNDKDKKSLRETVEALKKAKLINGEHFMYYDPDDGQVKPIDGV